MKLVEWSCAIFQSLGLSCSKLEHFYEVKQHKTEYVFDEHATFAQASFR